MFKKLKNFLSGNNTNIICPECGSTFDKPIFNCFECGRLVADQLSKSELILILNDIEWASAKIIDQLQKYSSYNDYNKEEISIAIMLSFKLLKDHYGILSNDNSFGEHYTFAVNHNDSKYINNAHLFIKMSYQQATDKRLYEILLDFMEDPPPNSLIYKSINLNLTYTKYYELYISEVKTLDPKSVSPEGLHWIELTDDAGIKRAFRDNIPPDQLAKHILDNVTIDQILF